MMQNPLLPEDDKLTGVNGHIFFRLLQKALTHANNGNWLQSRVFNAMSGLFKVWHIDCGWFERYW